MGRSVAFKLIRTLENNRGLARADSIADGSEAGDARRRLTVGKAKAGRAHYRRQPMKHPGLRQAMSNRLDKQSIREQRSNKTHDHKKHHAEHPSFCKGL